MILSKKFQDIIHGAIYLAVNELNHQYLTCEHILFCALDNKDVIKMFENFDVNISGLRNKLYQFLQYDLYDLTNKNLENSRIIKLKFTDHLVNFFERLVLRGNKNHSLLKLNNEIDIEDFILEILFDHESYSYFFLKKFNLNKDNLISYLKENEKKNLKKNQSKDFGSEIDDFLGQSNDKFKKDSNFSNSNKVDFFASDENLFGNNFNDKNYTTESFTNDKQKQFSQKQFSNYFGFSGKNSNSINSNSYNNSNNLGYLGGFIEEKDKSKNSILENYCVNFNLAAQKGKIDPIFDRDEEIDMLIKALYCRRKGNALLIGDSGVGKTAIIEYLAQKIVNNDKDIPLRLKNTLIYSLDLNSLISGTRYRGDLEERMKFLMNEIEESKQKIILFIDEIHTVIGTGSTNNGTLDIGNILKPYLARSMIYCVGATTRKEFTQFLSKDKAFLRRFQIIFVNEPSVQSAQKMIAGIIGKYESYHNVKYTKGAIEASVLLCKRYISDRHLPDGALDLIDYAGSSACINFEQKKMNISNNKIDSFENKKLNNLKNPLITRKDIEDSIVQIIKLPKKQISSNIFAKNLLEMKDFLNNKIIGQEAAIETVCKSIIANTSEIVSSKDTNPKPIASYIFYGPTGVGKTELAIQLSNYLNMKFIRIDMSEFSESHSVSKLFGAPPGYVGFEQSGILTEQVLKNPYSVILFDEIEKAHPNLMNSLLQILDYGNLTDNFGQKVSFSHSIIICTTNSGSKSMSKITPGFNSFGNSEITFKELENSFSPEFRNRFSAIISFKYLEKSIISKIIQSKFDEISKNLKKKNIELEIDDKIKQFLIDEKYDSLMGARIIDRIIEDEITSQISEIFFKSRLEKKSQIKKIILTLINEINNIDKSKEINIEEKKIKFDIL